MYSRFKALRAYNEEDQESLENSTAAVIGLGATGSAIAENLARHGVNLIILDRDYLELKDVYSSSLYDQDQCEKSLPKVEAARKKLEDKTSVVSHLVSLKPSNLDLISSADILLDGTDNLQTRQIINDFSKKEDIPWIYTAALAQEAYSMAFIEKCFNCMASESSRVATCETEGIMREVAQKAAAESSLKAIKILTGHASEEKLDFVHNGRSLEVEPNSCEVCRGEVYPHLERASETFSVCGEGKYQMEKSFSLDDVRSISLGEKLAENKHLIRLSYEGREVVFFDSGRAIVEAKDEGHAEATLSEILGI